MSKIIDELIACGVSSETLQIVMRLIADAENIQQRRAADRQRKQRWRDSHVTSRDVTRRHVPSQDVTGHESAYVREEERKKEREVQTPRKARKTVLPPDFIPDIAWAIAEKKWPSERAAAEAQRFKDHAIANARLQADWPAAWRNWVRSPYQDQQHKGAVNGHQQPEPRPFSREWRRERDARTLAEFHARARGSDPAGGLPPQRLSDPTSE